ncbi:nitroreductase family protein [Candidatus Bathyarchaeota archaeon]|nr:nitroreductase family protein [Candidatus Bathyarchaeota archaeon]
MLHDLMEIIKKRRSIRAFTKKEIPTEIVEQLIEAARWAPSAGNIQPWDFIIVTNYETKKLLTEAALGQKFIEEAPVVIVVCADENRSSQDYGLRGKTLYCLQDTAAATQNIHLLACSFELGSCWIGAFREDKTREILKIPDGIRPVAIIPIGYPAETPKPRSRRSIGEIVHFETY